MLNFSIELKSRGAEDGARPPPDLDTSGRQHNVLPSQHDDPWGPAHAQ